MLLDTPVCDYGWKAPDFTLFDVDGTSHSLAGSMGENGLVIAFICNHCPYVKAIIDRLVDDAATLSEQGVNMLAIMPNDYQSYPDDAPDKMRNFAHQHQMAFPYLIDEDQSVAKAYGAVCTPDFFGLNKAGELHYRGRLDDAKMGAATNRLPELRDAMIEIAKTGTGPASQIPSMGCSIKWR